MKNAVCFIGHREIKETEYLRQRLQDTTRNLIQNGITNFLFGDNSQFNCLCYESVTEIKKEYPEIKRIYFRKNYENADEYTMKFIVSGYEESICPKGIGRAGKAGYVERNRAMIDESEFCVFYYDEKYLPEKQKTGNGAIKEYNSKSGTGIAYKYAVKRKKKIINLCEND